MFWESSSISADPGFWIAKLLGKENLEGNRNLWMLKKGLNCSGSGYSHYHQSLFHKEEKLAKKQKPGQRLKSILSGVRCMGARWALPTSTRPSSSARWDHPYHSAWSMISDHGLVGLWQWFYAILEVNQFTPHLTISWAAIIIRIASIITIITIIGIMVTRWAAPFPAMPLPLVPGPTASHLTALISHPM